jgi:5-formyltetrahydrofolate cyclo-ligase
MTTPTKAALRAQLLAARSGVADAVRAAEARTLSEHLELVVTGGTTVCAYVPVGTEPGSLEMVDMLLRRSRRVLLPVARTAGPGNEGIPLPLRWGEYRPGTLVRGPWGLLEPAEPALPESVLGEADLVIVPALAVDRRGVRLGRGRGFYDRSLAGRAEQARLIAMVRDVEYVDELPAEAHDVPMTHVITPGRGVMVVFPSGHTGE